MQQVVQLRARNTKYDFTYRGKNLTLKIEPCTCGVIAGFSTQLKLKDIVPEELLHLVGDAEKPAKEHFLIQEHIELKWWEKLFGRTLDNKVARWAEKKKAEFEQSTKLAQDIQSKFEV